MVEILRQVARPELFFNLLDGFFHLGLCQKGKGGQHRAVGLVGGTGIFSFFKPM